MKALPARTAVLGRLLGAFPPEPQPGDAPGPRHDLADLHRHLGAAPDAPRDR